MHNLLGGRAAGWNSGSDTMIKYSIESKSTVSILLPHLPQQQLTQLGRIQVASGER
jgi:hypothetical protein